MICPKCGHKFPLDAKRFFMNKGGEHQCPKCGCIGKMRHRSRIHQYLNTLFVLLVWIIIIYLSSYIFETFFQLEILGLEIGTLLGLAIIIAIDSYYQEHFCAFEDSKNLSPGRINFFPHIDNILAIFLIPSLILIIIFVMELYQSRGNYKYIESFNKKLTAEIAPYEGAIMRDLKLLSQTPLLEKTTKTNDAGKFLNERISWSDNYKPYSKELKKLFKRHQKWWKDEKVLDNIQNDPAIYQFNTSILNGLNDYDHWVIETYPPYQKKLMEAAELSGEKKDRAFQNLPFPIYNDITRIGIVRFFQLHKQRKDQEALSLLRKLAQLYYSTGTITGNIHAKSLLDYEEALTKNFKIKNWQVVPKKIRNAFKRATLISQQIFLSSLFQRFPKKYFEYITPQTGMCAGGLEMITKLINYQDYLRPRFLFEDDYTPYFEQNLSLYSNLLKKCDKEEYKGFLSETPKKANPWFLETKLSWYEINGDQETVTTFNFSKLPFIRRREILPFLSEMYYPNYTKLYKSQKADKISK